MDIRWDGGDEGNRNGEKVGEGTEGKGRSKRGMEGEGEKEIRNGKCDERMERKGI